MAALMKTILSELKMTMKEHKFSLLHNDDSVSRQVTMETKLFKIICVVFIRNTNKALISLLI